MASNCAAQLTHIREQIFDHSIAILNNERHLLSHQTSLTSA